MCQKLVRRQSTANKANRIAVRCVVQGQLLRNSSV